jgi:hypothetical protein
MAAIIFIGVSYDSPEAMPPDVRRLYELALGMTRDADGDGVPDVMQGAASRTLASGTTFVVNGQAYGGLDQLPPEARAQYEQAMRRLDADGNGVPDLFEAAGALRASAAPAAPGASPAPAISPEPQVQIVGDRGAGWSIGVAAFVLALLFALLVVAALFGWVPGLR